MESNAMKRGHKPIAKYLYDSETKECCEKSLIDWGKSLPLHHSDKRCSNLILGYQLVQV